MIRRDVGDEFWLITQNDHAVVSGQLAEQFGSNGYSAPEPRAVRATAIHDCGWPLHDESPTLNGDGLPLDVFETPRHIGLMVWSESARRASEVDPYVGLLVSLHSLSLSVMATTHTQFTHERFDLSDRAARFEINKFQQAQVELQEQLRATLGMRTDEPRKFGLAELSDDPRERQLIFDFRLLQAMDKLSLAICCTTPPTELIAPVLTAPGAGDRPFRVHWIDSTTLGVSPWPFNPESISLRVPFRRMSNRPVETEQGFRVAFKAAAVEQFDVRLIPRVARS